MTIQDNIDIVSGEKLIDQYSFFIEKYGRESGNKIWQTIYTLYPRLVYELFLDDRVTKYFSGNFKEFRPQYALFEVKFKLKSRYRDYYLKGQGPDWFPECLDEYLYEIVDSIQDNIPGDFYPIVVGVSIVE